MSTPKQVIYKAIKEGDLETIRSNFGKVNKSKKYPLHWGDKKMKSFRNRWWNWVHYAVFFEQLEILKYLLEEVRIDANIQTILIVSRSKYYWDDSILHVAARLDLLEIANYIVTRTNIKKDVKNYAGKKAVDCATSEEMKKLIISGTYVPKMNMKMKKQMIDFELSECIDFALEELTDLKIKMARGNARSLFLFKSLFMFSNIPNLEKIEEFALQRHYDVNEREIIRFMIHDTEELLVKLVNNTSNEQLLDYFMFFRDLGLKYQMKCICQHLTNKIASFKDCMYLFALFCDRYEKKNRVDLSRTVPTHFETSLSYCLFLHLMTLYARTRNVPDPYRYQTLQRYFDKELQDPTKKSFLTHSDFDDVHFEDISTLSLMRRLESGHFWNIKLQVQSTSASTTPLIIKTHREILVLRYNHFMRMFRFRGMEWESLQTDKTIVIEDMEKDEVLHLVHYAYFGSISSDTISDFESVLRMIVISQKFGETKLLEDLFSNKLKKDFKDTPPVILEDTLLKMGHLLHLNEDVKQRILRENCQFKISYRRMFECMEKSYILVQMSQMQDQMLGMKMFIEEQKKLNMDLKKRISSLESKLINSCEKPDGDDNDDDTLLSQISKIDEEI